MPATLRTVRSFIEGASEADLADVTEAIRLRTQVLREQREAAIRVGVEVTLVDLSPQSLNGLTGTVKHLTTQRGARRCSVLLDVESTKALRGQSNRFSTTVSPNTKRHLLGGVPMVSCLQVEA